MTRYSQLIRTISNTSYKHVSRMITISNIKNAKLDIKKEDDYNIIQSIIDSYSGDIRFNIIPITFFKFSNK